MEARAAICLWVPDPQTALDRAVALGRQEAMPTLAVPCGSTMAHFMHPDGDLTGLSQGSPKG